MIDCAAGGRKQPSKAIPDKAFFDFIIRGTREIIFQTDLLNRNRAKPYLSQDFIVADYRIIFDEIRGAGVV
ncbi:MAG: hypothetical protein FVQ80_14160 [Planctomycetes bacterium]|nr:hypothetical protein [Planctomycetota bacterium]